MIRQSLDLAVTVNREVRYGDEWFEEPDDLDRVQRALDAIEAIEDVVTAAGVLAYRIARAQAFGEGNKRTAVALATWLLDRNGEDSASLLPVDDRAVADLLVDAAAGRNVEARIVEVLQSRRA